MYDFFVYFPPILTCTSSYVATYIKNNGIQHITTAPYHPASVQTFKTRLKKASTAIMYCNWCSRLDRFLFQYRITPHTTTGSTPAELLMGSILRSRLDLLLPSVQTRVVTKQLQHKANHDLHAKTRSFHSGDTVYTRNYSGGSKWIPGVITEITGPVSYKATLADGRILKRHLDQIRTHYDNTPITEDTEQWAHDTTDTPTLPSTAPRLAVRQSTRQQTAPDRYSPKGGEM